MKKMKRSIVLVIAVFIIGMMVAPAVLAESVKIGYVDLKKAFYEYEKSKNFDKELTALMEERGGKRKEMVDEIKKMISESELLSESARANKEKEIKAKDTALREYDQMTQQMLLNKKNEMFREVIEDIQKIAADIGKTDHYNYILDSRNIMYSDGRNDLTEEVLKKLNK